MRMSGIATHTSVESTQALAQGARDKASRAQETLGLLADGGSGAAFAVCLYTG